MIFGRAAASHENMMATFPELRMAEEDEVRIWSRTLRAIATALNSARENSIHPEFGNPEAPEKREMLVDFANWPLTMDTFGKFDSANYPSAKDSVIIFQRAFADIVWQHYYRWNEAYYRFLTQHGVTYRIFDHSTAIDFNKLIGGFQKHFQHLARRKKNMQCYWCGIGIFDEEAETDEGQLFFNQTAKNLATTSPTSLRHGIDEVTKTYDMSTGRMLTVCPEVVTFMSPKGDEPLYLNIEEGTVVTADEFESQIAAGPVHIDHAFPEEYLDEGQLIYNFGTDDFLLREIQNIPTILHMYGRREETGSGWTAGHVIVWLAACANGLAYNYKDNRGFMMLLCGPSGYGKTQLIECMETMKLPMMNIEPNLMREATASRGDHQSMGKLLQPQDEANKSFCVNDEKFHLDDGSWETSRRVHFFPFLNLNV